MSLVVGYFGDGPWAHRALESLIENRDYEVAFIIARYRDPDNTLREIAKKNDIEFKVFKSVNKEEFFDFSRDFNCDVFVSMSFNQIFKAEALSIPSIGVINCHASALPYYKGRNPLNWALINGEKEFGVTVHWVDEGIDSGDIIVQHLSRIYCDDGYGDLLARAYDICSKALFEALEAIRNGTAERISQSTISPYGCFGGRRQPGDEWIDWSWDSARIHNFVRALSPPGPCARSLGDHGLIGIAKTEILPNSKVFLGTPGEVIGRSSSGVIVKTGDTQILLKSVIKISENNETGEAFVPSWRVATRLGISFQNELIEAKKKINSLELRLSAIEDLMR